MSLTTAEKRRLAAAARDLAFEIACGVAPDLAGYDYAYCAIGEMNARISGRRSANDGADLADKLIDCDPYIAEAAKSVEQSLFMDFRIYGSTVFPLLWLADELEASP